ncbi:MAG TPA: hypothetical protein VEI97_13400, partial [bacterium]|nr:hypothetical protein [bacterium]
TWNAGQVLVVLGIAELAGWDPASRGVMASEMNSGDEEREEEPPFIQQRERKRRHHKPFWRDRK